MQGAMFDTSVPGECLHSIRNADVIVAELDRLSPLLNSVMRRILVSDHVAASKFGTDSPIDHPARERQALEQVKCEAGALGLAPDGAVGFFEIRLPQAS